MTTLRSGLVTGTSLLPDVADRWEDIDAPPSVEVIPRQIQFDTAIEMSRRNTPQSAIDQRKAPRYSLREVNSLDDDAIRARIQALDPNDDRPGWIKFLDIIDAPRNFVGKTVAKEFLPEAYKRALERGERDQFGQPKVYGADLLRAMGVENRVVNGVGGFLVDVVTDPLSWVGGPIGGLKSAGVAGTVQVGKQGQRALRTGLKAVQQGRPIVDDITRKVVDATIAAGKASGELDQAADIATAGQYARAAIYGQQGLVSKAAETVGLGKTTKGGVLANDTFRSVRAAASPEEAARIEAVKQFVGRYTNNRGMNLTGGKAGAEVAHVPLTDITLTTPSFRIPGLGITPGRAAVLQHAVSMAERGDFQGGAAVMAAANGYQEAKAIADRMATLADERAALNIKLTSRREQDAPTLARWQKDLADLDTRIADAQRAQAATIKATTAGPVRDAMDPATRTRLAEVARQEINEIDARILDAEERYAVAAFRADDTPLSPEAQAVAAEIEQLRAARGAVVARQPDAVATPPNRVVDIGEGVDQLASEAPFTGPVRTIPPDRVPPVDESGQALMFGGRQAPLTPEQAGVRPNAADDLLAERARLAGAIDELSGPNLFTQRLAELTDEFAQTSAQLANWRDGLTARRQVVAGGAPGALEVPQNLDDLMLAAELQRKAFAEAKRAEALTRWQNAQDLVARATPKDIKAAQRLKRMIADEVRVVAGMDPETAVDEVLAITRQDDGLRRLRDARMEHASIRLQRLVDLSESDLQLAEEVADAFQASAGAAAEVAALRGGSMTRALSSDQRLLADAARQIFQINDREAGTLPFAAFDRVAQSLGQFDAAAGIADLGNRAGRSFGGLGGLVPQAMAAYRRAVDLAETQGADIAMQFERGFGEFSGVRGLKEISKVHNVPSQHYADLDALIELRMEASLRGDNLAQPVFQTHEGSAAHGLMTRLTDAGVLQNTDLMADVDALAGRVAEMYQRMGAEAVMRGDFSSTISRYAPVQLTGQAAARVKALSGQSGGPVKDVLNTLMDPSQARKTDIVEFVDGDGNPQSFLILEAEVFGKMSDDDLEAMRIVNAEGAARAESIRDTVRAFEERYADGVDLDTVLQEVGRPLMPFELNEMAARGVFDTMVGGRILDQGSMWETSAMGLLSRRVAADRVAEATHGFKEAIEPHVLTRIKAAQTDALAVGDTAKLATGQEIKNIGHRRFRVGGRVYRPLETSAMQHDSLFVPDMIYGKDAHELLVPDTLATQIERMNETLTPKNINPILGIADRVTSLWKVGTLTHLSWPISNAIGNTTLLAMDNPELLTNPKRAAAFGRHFKDAVKVLAQRNTGGRLHNDLGGVSIGGTFMPTSDVIRAADAGGVMTGGVAGDMLRQFMRSTSTRQPVADAIPGAGPLGAMRDRRNRALAEYAAARGTESPGQMGSAVDQLRAARKAFTKGPLSSVTRAWFGVNGAIDDAFRLAYFMQLLDDGMDAQSAANRVRYALLNFGDMTPLERNVVRPLIPFYAWARASLPNMIMKMGTDPKQLAAVPKLATAFEELLAGENRVPRHKRPRWLQQTMAIQVGSDPETARSLQLGTLLPQEGALQVGAGALGLTGLGDFDGQDFMDLMSWSIGQAGPAVKIPLELGTQRETFTNRTIGLAEGDGDVTLPQYLAGQVRWAREAGVGAPGPGALQRAFEQGPVAGIARATVGGRFSPDNLSTERRQSAFRAELKGEESELRKAISRADNRGDNEAMADLREKLIGVYHKHILRGGNPEDVPKWARDDIETLTSVGGLAQ